MKQKSVFQSLAQKWWIGLLILVLTLATTAYFTNKQPSIYEAKATYVTRINDTITEGRQMMSAMDVLNRQNDVLTTYSEVAKSQMIKTRAGQSLGLEAAQLRRLNINSRVISGTNILEISVVGEVPGLVRDFTNAVGMETAAYSNSLYTAYQLEQLDGAQTPGRPVGSRMTLNLIAGSVLGIFLGFMVMLIAAWVSGDLSDTSTDESAQAILAVENQIEELRKQSMAIRNELMEARATFHDTLLEARVLSDALHKVNGQITK